MKKTRIYPRAEADGPSDNDWVNWTEWGFNTVHANDFSFYEEIDELVQDEPIEALDAERAGQLAAIGIIKGQQFDSDECMRGILEQAAGIAAGMARALAYAPRDPERRCTGPGSTRSSAAVTSFSAAEPGCSTSAPCSTISPP